MTAVHLNNIKHANIEFKVKVTSGQRPVTIELQNNIVIIVSQTPAYSYLQGIVCDHSYSHLHCILSDHSYSCLQGRVCQTTAIVIYLEQSTRSQL